MTQLADKKGHHMNVRNGARRRTTALALMSLVTTALAACGGGENSASSSSDSSSTSAETMEARLVVGGEKAMVFMAIPLAQGLGYLEEEGVDLEVIDAGDAGRAVGTLLAGQADFASGAFEHVIKAKEKDQDLVMTALYVKYPAMSLLVGADSVNTIKSIEDLRGKRVGTSSPGSAAHYNLIQLLKVNGMTEKDVELVFAGLSEMPAAIKNGQVVAGMVVDPFTTQAVRAGTGEILFDLGTEKGSQELYDSEYAMSGLMTRAEVIEKDPELVRRVTAAASRALEYIGSHSPREVAEAMPEGYSSDLDTLTAAVEHMQDSFSDGGMMPPEAAETTARVLVENGVVSKKAVADVSSLYDMQFLDRTGGG